MLKIRSKLRRNRYLLGLIYITANKAKYSDKGDAKEHRSLLKCSLQAKTGTTMTNQWYTIGLEPRGLNNICIGSYWSV